MPTWDHGTVFHENLESDSFKGKFYTAINLFSTHRPFKSFSKPPPHFFLDESLPLFSIVDLPLPLMSNGLDVKNLAIWKTSVLKKM